MDEFEVWSIGPYVRVLIKEEANSITKPEDSAWIPAHAIQQIQVHNGLVLCVTPDKPDGWPAGAYEDDFDADQARLRLVSSLAGISLEAVD